MYVEHYSEPLAQTQTHPLIHLVVAQLTSARDDQARFSVLVEFLNATRLIALEKGKTVNEWDEAVGILSVVDDEGNYHRYQIISSTLQC